MFTIGIILTIIGIAIQDDMFLIIGGIWMSLSFVVDEIKVLNKTIKESIMEK